MQDLTAMTLEEYQNIPIRTQDLADVYPDCKDLPGKVSRLERAGDLIRLKKGLYIVAPRVSRKMLSPFLIANHLNGPSYISMESALRYYGLIPEAVYETISVTTGIARSYRNAVGAFRYIRSPLPYYAVGVTMEREAGIVFQIATPEKALCDQIVFSPRLNLRYREETLRYLEEDLRLDMDEFYKMNVDLLRQCAAVSRKKTMINQLIKLIDDGGNI
jgi:predicted transcriptional regulator of viral defense system